MRDKDSEKIQPADDGRRFFGEGSVFDAYKAAPAYRTGEEYVFRRFLNPGGNLLDVGCGTGRTCFLLAPSFPGAVAFDIVPEMVEFAHGRQRTKHGVNYLVADATDPPFPASCFDNVIFSYNGIEGIPTAPQRTAALRELHRVMKTGGRLIFTTKSCFYWRYLKDFRLKILCRRMGLPLFPEVAGMALGDIIYRDGDQETRWHTSSPFRVKATLREIGFELLYFNSECRMAAGRFEPSLRAHFDPWDHFFVCEK